MSLPTTSQSSKINPALKTVDIGVNLTNKAFRKNWRSVVQRAIDAGVETLLLTGTSLKEYRQSLAIAQQWQTETTDHGPSNNLCCTVGVHPHHAKTYDDDKTTGQLREILTTSPLAVAVGECGLDYNRNFSSHEDQLKAFRAQVELACELNLPLFVHEREAHEDLLSIFDQVLESGSVAKLPPVVIHCFTGTKQEAQTYIERGFFVGFTGTICKRERGAHLRALLPTIPLGRIMIETDAPFMGFKKGRRGSEPADVVDVARKIGETLNLSLEEVCNTTTHNARLFFGFDRASKDK